MSSPFTYDELYQAYRRVATASNAADMARASVVDNAAAGPLHESGVAFRSVPEVLLSDDTLILLSLVSEELNVRVERYRVWFRCGEAEPPDDAAAWHRRRAQVKAWADAGYTLGDSADGGTDFR